MCFLVQTQRFGSVFCVRLQVHGGSNMIGTMEIVSINHRIIRSQRPRSVRRGSAAGCLLAGIAGSNPAGGVDVCL
jgi:hypothetical protein